MKLSITQRLYLGLTAGYLIVITVGILSYRSYQKQIRQSKWVQHTHEVINKATSVKQLITQLENNKRNTFFSDNTPFVEAFGATSESLLTTLNQLSILVRDNDHAVKQVSEMEDSAVKIIDYWKDLGAHEQLDTAALRKSIRIGTGSTSDVILSIDRFIAYENQLLAERNVLNEESAQQSIATLLGGLLLVLLIVSVLSFQVYHDVNARIRSQKKLKQNLEEMEAMNAETSQQNWQLSSLSSINNLLQRDYYEDVSRLAQSCTEAFTKILKIPSAILYQFGEEQQRLIAIGQFAVPVNLPPFHSLGVGVIGQAAKSKEITVIDDLPDDIDWTLEAGISPIKPKSLVLVPLWVDDQLVGLLGLIGLKEFSPLQIQLLDLISHNLASTMQSVMIRKHLEELVSQISKQKEELETTQDVLTEQAAALEQSNHYKSSFLANMSHELRTPLNSILILANLLSENKEGKLPEKQQEYGRIIHKSGSDLLHLINDILDLSKIEAGKIELFAEELRVSSILSDMQDSFGYLAEERQIQFSVENMLNPDQEINTDKKRAEQILKNLISNAIKFTPAGGYVRVSVQKGKTDDLIDFVVKDNGKGIAEEYQMVIFEAFQQVDGATNRQYGGTGLGLSISKQLAEQLGGILTLSSTLGKGSEFTLSLPFDISGEIILQKAENQQTAFVPTAPQNAITIPQNKVADDRHIIAANRQLLLIIEDDENFATILRDFARSKDYQTIVALTGEEGLYYARKYKPSAILLDIHLPGMLGTDIIYTLKRTPELSNIPVHVITSHDGLGYLAKEIEGLTIKPFEANELEVIFKKLGHQQGQASTQTSTEQVDKRIPAENIPQIETVVVPTEEVDLSIFDGCKVLLTDDDMRNVYALTAVLEAYGMHVISASNGEEALEQLSLDKTIQLILMDIMMPIMDGYETIGKIRENVAWKNIPIIAISAKAMSGDRQKAIDAGASAYLTKPVDRALLLSTMQKSLTK